MMRPTSPQFDSKQDDPSFLEKHQAKRWFNMRGGYSFIAWQCGPRGNRLTPFHDRRVRLAMTHLIDRDMIREEISKGLVRVATGPFNSTTPSANPDITPWPHDLDRAAELLEEAGWVDRDGDGWLENEDGEEFEFELTFSNGSESTLQMVTLVKDLCARTGIRCELNPIDWSILSDLLNKRDFDAITFAWSASAPESDPNQVWHSSQIDGQGDNFVQWSNAEADRLIELGRAELDADERVLIWRRLHSVFHEEQPYTFLSEIPWMRFTNRRAGNVMEYKSGLEYDEFYIRGPSGGSAAMLP